MSCVSHGPASCHSSFHCCHPVDLCSGPNGLALAGKLSVSGNAGAERITPPEFVAGSASLLRVQIILKTKNILYMPGTSIIIVVG